MSLTQWAADQRSDQEETVPAGSLDPVDSVSLLGNPPLAQSFAYLVIKRWMDVFGAIIGLMILSPVFFLIALIIKATDGGPILFVQTRVGKDGQPFAFYKFRSMIIDAEQLKAKLALQNHHADPRTFKIPNDPRITWIGFILRRTSLDEAPQLWNILMGDMSLVGPRPPVPSEVELYTQRDLQRLSVVPGLTGLWQIRGRGNLPFSKQVDLDIEYIQNRGLWTDVKILWLTIPAVLTARGAY